MAKKTGAPVSKRTVPDGRIVIEAVLKATKRDVAEAEAKAIAEKNKKFKKDLRFSISFAKHMGSEVARALHPYFRGIESGEKRSQAVRGLKRVDVKYATREAGLGLALSFKSVHQGEEGGDADFTHNMKRNDEELRVEATGHHLRQPYAVMVAVVFLPLEACHDAPTLLARSKKKKKSLPISSFASWVEYLWPLKGRTEPEDPPDRYELVYMGLYARDASELGFYEIGGSVPCPREGRPKQLQSLDDFFARIREVYDARNGRDFYFAGEQPKK